MEASDQASVGEQPSMEETVQEEGVVSQWEGGCTTFYKNPFTYEVICISYISSLLTYDLQKY